MKSLHTAKPYVRFNPLNDYLFLKVMGEKGDEIQLLGFLNAVLGKAGNRRLTSVEIIENKVFSAEVLGDKSCILDVRAELHDGTKVNIEVQLRSQGNMDKRSLFYWGKEFTKGLKAGQDYSELHNAITVNIVNFQFLDTENFHTIFHLREDTEPTIVLTDALEIHFIDMVRYRKQRRKDMQNELHRWLAWLDENSPPELIAEVVGTDDEIKAAEERLVYVTGDDDAIRAYEMRQMALSDITSQNNFARKEGLAKGRAEGIAESNLDHARKMKAIGIPTDHIQNITGLSPEIIGTL